MRWDDLEMADKPGSPSENPPAAEAGADWKRL